MPRAIVVTSGKGGVGKTTLTAALGKVLAENGQRTVLLDADIGLNNLDVLMNVENRITFDITDVVENRCRPRQALVEDPFTRGLFVLPSAHGYDSGAINGQALRAVIRSLLKTFDYCFVDCPAGVEAGFHRAVTACDEALVVVTPHISSVRDADKVLRLLAGYGIGADVVINRARGDLMLTEEMIPVGEVARALSVTPIGVIPESDRINLASNFGFPSGSDTGEAIRILAENLMTGSRIQYDVTKKYRGLLGAVRRGLRRKM